MSELSLSLVRSLSLEARYALLVIQKESNRHLWRALAAEHEAARLRRKLELMQIAVLSKREFRVDCDE
jgi:hypothetical protein